VQETRQSGVADGPSDEPFRLVVEAAPNAMVMINGQGRIVMVNGQAERVFGYDRSEMLGQLVEMLVPTRLRGHHPALRAAFTVNPSPRPMGVGRDLYALRRDGTEFPVEIGLNPIQTSDGPMVLSAIVDLSLRRQSAERFRQVVEAAPNAMVMINGDGQIVMVNAQVERLFGYDRSELLGRPVEILVPDRHRAAHPGLRGGFFRHGHGSRPMGAGRDLFARRKDGSEFPVEIGLNPITMDEGPMVLSAIVDISDRVQQLQRMNDRLEARTRDLEVVNQELEAFAYSVSHDLRAPLRSMDGFSQALLEDYDAILDDRGKDYLARVRRGAVRMGQLIDDLLKLSRVTRSGITPVAVDLSAIADAVMEELRQHDPHRPVQVVIAPGLLDVADPRLMRVVLDNLLGNAWKFTKSTATPLIRFTNSRQGGQMTYQVSDNGVGFDMAYADKLFSPFQRLHATHEFEGTGIGLATVARIIRRHGGTIEIQSEPGKGTVVSFTLNRGDGWHG